MTYDEMVADRERASAERMKRVVEASRMTQEVLDALGLRGSPGFMGQGVYDPSDRREPGYVRSGR